MTDRDAGYREGIEAAADRSRIEREIAKYRSFGDVVICSGKYVANIIESVLLTAQMPSTPDDASSAEVREALAMIINPNADWDKPYRDSEHPATLRHESEMASRREAARRLADRILSSGLVAPAAAKIRALPLPSTPDDGRAEPVERNEIEHRLAMSMNDTLCEMIDNKEEMITTVITSKVIASKPFQQAIDKLASHPSPASDGAIRVTDEVVDYIARYGGACRDCADENGICPHSGLPCADRGKAIRHVLTALNYGVANGFISAHAVDAAK